MIPDVQAPRLTDGYMSRLHDRRLPVAARVAALADQLADARLELTALETEIAFAQKQARS